MCDGKGIPDIAQAEGTGVVQPQYHHALEHWECMSVTFPDSHLHKWWSDGPSASPVPWEAVRMAGSMGPGCS